MGRIAFFTERLPPDTDPISTFSYDLVKTLADQQHEVRVFSTYFVGSELPPTRSRIEILRPFKRWSWLELPRMLPLLVEFQPDVIHVVQPRAEALGGWTNAMSALPTFSALLGKPAVVASFYDLREDKLSSHRALLHGADAVTVSSRPQLDLLSKYFAESSKRPLTTLVPVPSAPQEIESETLEGGRSDFLREFLSSSDKVVFVPGNVDEHPNSPDLFMTLADVLAEFPSASVVFGGGWGDVPPLARHSLMSIFETTGLGNRVLISGALDASALRYCLAHAQVVLLASISMTSLRLTQVLSEGLASGAVLVISREQSLLAAVPWQDRENAFLVDSELTSWSQAIREALSSNDLVNHIRGQVPDFARSEALDQPGNAVSRLYAQILERKRPNRR